MKTNDIKKLRKKVHNYALNLYYDKSISRHAVLGKLVVFDELKKILKKVL